MTSNELRAAHGRRVRITAGIRKAEGTLGGFQQSTMTIGVWGGDVERPGNEWYLVLDGQHHEFPLDAELELLD